MPRIITSLMKDFALGCLLGAALLLITSRFIPFGVTKVFLDTPLLVQVAIVLGGIVPFAQCFAATGLEFRTQESRGSEQ